MTWEFKPAREHFSAFVGDWDRLNAELYRRHPMFDSRFVGPLLQHFGDGTELLCIHRTGDTIDGALILRPRGLGRWSLFLPAQLQAGAVMVKDASLLDTLLPTLPGHAWSLDLLAIDPAYAPDWSFLRLPRIVTLHATTMAVAVDGNFTAYWQARPKNLIKNVRRYQRRAAASAGPLTVATYTEPDAVLAAVARYGKLESAGWKGKEGTAIASDNAQGRFYAETLARFAASGQARVVELRAGDRLVASRLFICHEAMWIILKTTYDETQSAYAPGRLLLHAVLERAFAAMPDGSVEFYTNTNRDQAEWANVLRPILHHQIVRNDITIGLLGIFKALRRSSEKTAKATGLNPVVIHSYPTIATLPSSARALFDQAETQHFEFAAGWFANLQQTLYPNDHGVRYYVAERAGRPVAILPVRLARYGMVRRVEAFANVYTSIYSPILATGPNGANELDLVALLQAASRDHGCAHEMRIAPMDPAAPAYAATIAALRSIGWVCFKYFCFGNWRMDVDSDWKTYLERRSSKLRNTLKRKSKKFAAAAGTLEIITEPARAETAIVDFNHVYSRSWKKPEPNPEFIPGVIRWLAEKGWLRLGIARLAREPIGAQIWIVAHGKASIFKLAYHATFGGYGAGSLLTAHLMQQVIDYDRVCEVDYLSGDDLHKKDWMNKRRERWGIIAYNARTALGFMLLVNKTLRKIARHLFLYRPISGK